MSAVAIITARGGSKRIPRKNVRDFLGRPIIEYFIRAALIADRATLARAIAQLLGGQPPSRAE